MSERDGRLGIGIVGAGRVGPVLGAALGGAGHALVGINAVSQAARDRAEAMLPGVPVLEVPDVVERSELVILAVPESELAGLVAGLAATGGWQPGQLVVHTAAAQGVGVLAPAMAAGPVLPIAQALVVEMGAEPVVIAEADRPAYAEAIGLARDYSDTIVGRAVERLRGIGVERPGRVLGPLVRSAVENALDR